MRILRAGAVPCEACTALPASLKHSVSLTAANQELAAAQKAEMISLKNWQKLFQWPLKPSVLQPALQQMLLN